MIARLIELGTHLADSTEVTGTLLRECWEYSSVVELWERGLPLGTHHNDIRVGVTYSGGILSGRVHKYHYKCNFLKKNLFGVREFVQLKAVKAVVSSHLLKE